MDIIRYKNKTLGQIEYYKVRIKQQKQSISSSHGSSCWCIRNWIQYQEWYKYKFHMDSRNWCILAIFRELFEIALQSQALLVYNGTNLFNPNDVFLANHPEYIELFAGVIFLNCVTEGILWFFICVNRINVMVYCSNYCYIHLRHYMIYFTHYSRS